MRFQGLRVNLRNNVNFWVITKYEYDNKSILGNQGKTITQTL